MKIEFNNVSFSYDNKVNVLENINFVLDKSEIVFILGHTGSGKSTLIQQLNGLLFPSKGEVKIVYKDYFINSNNLPYVCHWARLCEFSVISYEEVMYINW